MTSLEKKARKSTATRPSKDSSWGSAVYGARNSVKRLHAPGYSPILILRASTAWMAWCRTCRSSKRPGAERRASPWWRRTPATFGSCKTGDNRAFDFAQGSLSAGPTTVTRGCSRFEKARLQAAPPHPRPGPLSPLTRHSRSSPLFPGAQPRPPATNIAAILFVRDSEFLAQRRLFVKENKQMYGERNRCDGRDQSEMRVPKNYPQPNPTCGEA